MATTRLLRTACAGSFLLALWAASAALARDGGRVEPGQVVINEFAASNTFILDPAGEAEDWIEFFNTTGQAIALDSLRLSDNPALPEKWTFPAGTSIAADGYLIVWADEDLDQPGLHANFKLSAGGEEIVLSNPDLSQVDAVVFGAQATNVSMARVPDGEGDFQADATPTPGTWNAAQPLDAMTLHISLPAPGLVRLSWVTVAGATAYDLYRTGDPRGWPALPWQSVAAPATHLDTAEGLGGGAWYFRGVARDGLSTHTGAVSP